MGLFTITLFLKNERVPIRKVKSCLFSRKRRSINRESKGLGNEKRESRLSSSTLICNKKQRRIENIVVILDGGEDKIRRWDEMHGPLLVKIFQGVSIWNLMFWVCTVWHSWLSSVLDTLFPSSTVLDLRILDTLKERFERSRGLNLLRWLLETRPQTQWTTFYNSTMIWLRKETVLYIAQRTPCLQYLVIHNAGVITIQDRWEALPYWKDLRGVNLSFFHCDEFITRAYELRSCCKKICSLTLGGRFGSGDAAAIARNFPKLKCLDLQHCILSREALVIILDGCKGLTRLDLRHSRCVDKENFA